MTEVNDGVTARPRGGRALGVAGRVVVVTIWLTTAFIMTSKWGGTCIGCIFVVVRVCAIFARSVSFLRGIIVSTGGVSVLCGGGLMTE